MGQRIVNQRRERHKPKLFPKGACPNRFKSGGDPSRSAEASADGTIKPSPAADQRGGRLFEGNFLRGTRQDFAIVSDERVTSFAIFSLNHLRLDAGQDTALD